MPTMLEFAYAETTVLRDDLAAVIMVGPPTSPTVTLYAVGRGFRREMVYPRDKAEAILKRLHANSGGLTVRVPNAVIYTAAIASVGIINSAEGPAVNATGEFFNWQLVVPDAADREKIYTALKRSWIGGAGHVFAEDKR